jgi:hypothetical protein
MKNYYDVIYKTKSGRAMVAKRVEAKSSTEAKSKIKNQMRASYTFDKVITTIKL